MVAIHLPRNTEIFLLGVCVSHDMTSLMPICVSAYVCIYAHVRTALQIEVMEGCDAHAELEVLELGSNRIRVRILGTHVVCNGFRERSLERWADRRVCVNVDMFRANRKLRACPDSQSFGSSGLDETRLQVSSSRAPTQPAVHVKHRKKARARACRVSQAWQARCEFCRCRAID